MMMGTVLQFFSLVSTYPLQVHTSLSQTSLYHYQACVLHNLQGCTQEVQAPTLDPVARKILSPTLHWQKNSNICSSPRKDKYSKSPTGKYLVPHERIIRVNPNGGKQGGIPEKESPGIANPKGYPSWRQTELIPKCQRENSNEDPSWRQKELIPRCQRENFAPTEFEIQIWVLNFGRRVQYSNICINKTG